MSDRTEQNREDFSSELRSELPTSFSLGGFGPSLRQQGFSRLLGDSLVERFDRCDVAISLLFAHGLLTYSQHVKSREKLAALVRSANAKALAKLSDGPEGQDQSPDAASATNPNTPADVTERGRG